MVPSVTFDVDPSMFVAKGGIIGRTSPAEHEGRVGLDATSKSFASNQLEAHGGGSFIKGGEAPWLITYIYRHHP